MVLKLIVLKMAEGTVFKTKEQQIRDIADGFFEGAAEGKKRYKMGKTAFLICKEITL